MALPSIEVKITADTKGVEAGVRRTTAEVDKATKSLGFYVDETGRARLENGRFVKVTDQMRKAVSAAGLKMDDLVGSYDRLRPAADRASQSTRRVRDGLGGLGAAAKSTSGKMSPLQMGIQNASRQMSDFTVQVTSGQSAATALSQQLPQLLDGFGVFGAVLSAIVPIGIAVGIGMKAMADSGRDVTSVFGTLEPLAQGISTAMGRIGEILIDVAELVINNLDRIITIAATAAAFFAGRWVAAFIAARVATFSLSTALVALRGALIRTGFGALIVAAGELVFQFTRLVKAVGGISEAFAVLKEVAAEVVGRVGQGFQGLYLLAQSAAKGIAGAFVQAAANIITPLQKAFNFIASSFNALASKAGMSEIQMPQATFASDLGGLADSLFRSARESAGAAGESFRGMTAPLKSIQKIRDLLAGMKEENLSLDGILFGGDGEEDDGGGSSKDKAGKKLDEKLTAQEERIKSFFDRIKALTVGGLSDKLGAWGDYFSGLVSLTGTQNEKLLRIAKTAKAGQALVDAWAAYNQVLADPSFIGRPWARVAAAGQVLAAGLGAVSAIKGVSSGGGSAGSSGSSSASSSSSSSSSSSGGSSPLMVGWNATNPNDLITVGMAQKMFEMISDEAGDRGFTIMRTA